MLMSTFFYANNGEVRTGTIKGKVVDASINQPLPYVNVVIKNSADEIVTGGITTDDGSFEIKKVPEGNLSVNIQYIGYKTVSTPVVIGNGNYNIDLGNVMLEEDVSSLDEVTVVAEVSTIEQKVDRKVINIGKDLTTTGPTASDIMNNLPSVNVDQQTGAISLRGNQNVRVMVDGKISNIPAEQLLKQIPSTSIKQIELITNPSAKYNPDGMSGIINIVLHKNANIGFNGNVSLGYTIDIKPKYNGSIDMNYRNGKLNFFGNYGTNFGDRLNWGRINRVEQDITQYLNILNNNESHIYKVGLDYYINDNHTLSVFTTQNSYNGGVDGNTRILFDNDPSLNQQQQVLNDNENNSGGYNLDYKIDFAKEGHNIEFEADYNTFKSDSRTDNIFQTNSRPDFVEFNDTDRNTTTLNLDYVNPLTEKSKLEMGLQAILFNTDLLYSSDGRNQDENGNYFPSTTQFDYKRDIYSAYATYGNKLDKWTYQVGIRAEQVNVDANALTTNLDDDTTVRSPFENDYFQIYPSAFLTYSPSEKNSYQISYSRRIDRPGVGQVNPVPEFTTPLITQIGNQALEPQFTNSIELNYTRNMEKGNITAGVFYRAIEDEINFAVLVDRSDLNRIILTSENFDNTSSYGFELSSNYRPTKWWSINGSFDLFSQTQKSITERLDPSVANPTVDDIILEVVEVDNVAWNLRMFNNFKVSNKLSFSAFAFYRGKNQSIQFEMQPMYFVNLGMRYNFLKDNRATLSINYNDIFNTMESRIEGQRPFRQRAEFNWESQTFYAGLSYRFGGGKYRAKSRKNRDDNTKDGGGGFF